MTEGQWTWMMVHMAIDNDEQLEKTCNKCKANMQESRCVHCGDKMMEEMESNPQFDDDLFEQMKSQAE